MHNEVCGMILHRHISRRSLSRAGFISENNVAEEDFAVVRVGKSRDEVRLHHRERQDIGRFILLAVLLVERADFGIRGKPDGDFDGCGGSRDYGMRSLTD